MTINRAAEVVRSEGNFKQPTVAGCNRYQKSGGPGLAGHRFFGQLINQPRRSGAICAFDLDRNQDRILNSGLPIDEQEIISAQAVDNGCEFKVQGIDRFTGFRIAQSGNIA